MKEPQELEANVEVKEGQEGQGSEDAGNPTGNPTLSAEQIIKRSGELESGPSAEQKEVEELKKVNLDDIKDPVAREYAERRIKELESGVNKKFEEIASKRKELEEKLADSSKPWTPERIKSLLQDQDFLSSVQVLQNSAAPQDFEGSDEDWSSLSSSEKQEFESLRRENQSTRQQVNKLLQAQEDEKIKETYPDYEPTVVDNLQKGLMDGTIQATRKDLWKVSNFDSAVEKAYKIGLQDGNKGISDKINAGSNFNEMHVNAANEVPEEVQKKGLNEILRFRLNQVNKK